MDAQGGSQVPDITAKDVQGRAEAFHLTRTDRDAALRVARQIVHPWYRCQSLAAVAEQTAGLSHRAAVLAEAVKAAYEQVEPNRIACVAAWPLQVLVADDEVAARPLVIRLLSTISTEPHGLRRLHGLRGILGAVLNSAQLRELVLPEFFRTAEACLGWRTERLVAHMAAALGAFDVEAARALVSSRGPNRFSSQALAALASTTQEL